MMKRSPVMEEMQEVLKEMAGSFFLVAPDKELPSPVRNV